MGARGVASTGYCCEQTVREKLPEGFQRSEFLKEKGAIDIIVDRRDMRNTLSRMLAKFIGHPSLNAK